MAARRRRTRQRNLVDQGAHTLKEMVGCRWTYIGVAQEEKSFSTKIIVGASKSQPMVSVSLASSGSHGKESVKVDAIGKQCLQ